MKVQRQSEGTKKGSGASHDKAVANLVRFLRSKDLVVYYEWVEFYTQKFVKDNKWKKEPSHSYDVVASKQKNNITYGPAYYIEIDGEKHSHTEQKINDGIAGKYVTEVLKQKLIRLNKRECLGDKEDRENYFYKKLEVLLLDG